MKIYRALAFTLSCLAFLAACNGNENEDGAPADPDNVVDPTPPPSNQTSWWKPVTGVSFDWQLDDIDENDAFAADIVDVDAFTTSAETVALLHGQGKKVIAYVSFGTLEADRPDGYLIPQSAIGKIYPEWPQEKWLDIRQIEKLKPWLNSRFNMVIKKGFDGIEPDNLDGYENDTGFDIGISDIRAYCDYLIAMAHSNGLSIGQKNLGELTAGFAAKFDWALTEDAFFQGWQDQLSDYIQLNKPVFTVEYTDEMSQSSFQQNVCPAASQLHYTAILKKRDLDAWVYRCD